MHAARTKEATAVGVKKQKNERCIWNWLPILIDISRNLAFIKLHAPLFVLHRLQKKLRLLLTHLPVLLRFRLCDLGALIRLIWIFLSSAFDLSGSFFLGRPRGAGVGEVPFPSLCRAKEKDFRSRYPKVSAILPVLLLADR